MNVADFVRDIRAARNALQGMKDDVQDLNRELDQLSDKRVNVRVDIDGQDEIRELREDLDRLSRESVSIDVNLRVDRGAIRELRRDLERLSALGDVSVDVRVNVRGENKVTRLLSQLRTLTARRWTVDIDLDGITTALAQLIVMRRLLNDTGDSLNNVGNAAGGAGASFAGMGPMILGLIPLLVTLGTVAAGVGAGMVGSLASIGVGLGAFAAFAIPTFKAVTEAVKGGEEAIAKLPPPMQIAARNLIDFKERFKELQKEMQPTALQVFAEGLNFVRSGMESVFKVAKPAGEAIRDLLAAGAEGLQGDDWQKFFTYMRDNVGWFIRTWGTAIGNFITGIANMIRAFDPLSKFVSNGFLGMSESFLKWTQSLQNNQQFQQFVQYVMANGPVILQLIGSFLSTAIQLAVAMAPLGAAMLQVVTQIMGAVAAFLLANPEIAKFLGVVIPLAAIIVPLISGIMTLAGAIAALSAPVLIAIAAIAAVVAIVLVWWNQCESFRTFVKELWADIAATFLRWVGMIKDMIADWLPAIVELWNKYGKNIMQVVKGIWTVIKGVIEGALRIIRGIINVVLGLLTGDWNRVWQGIKQILSGVWVAIASIVKGGKDLLIGLLNSLLQGIGNIFKGVGELLWNAGKAIVNGLKRGIENGWGSLVGWFKGKLGDLRNMLPFSPAKVGPFSGKGWTEYSGKAIVEGLAKGMAARQTMLKQTMNETLAMARGTMNSNFGITATGSYIEPKQSPGVMAAQAGVSGSVVFSEGAFKIYNPSAEAPSDSINRTMTRVSRFGILEGTS
ncbi:hypothetical protein [Streptomyces sp. NPDC006477]|uniref:hypothetical protein n=1 Tax=Streptomyces sp. NPDC006477 TaxID=3364747 RepID=UPI0036C2B479